MNYDKMTKKELIQKINEQKTAFKELQSQVNELRKQYNPYVRIVVNIYWYLHLMRTIEKQIDIEVISSLLSSIQVNTIVDFGSSDN